MTTYTPPPSQAEIDAARERERLACARYDRIKSEYIAALEEMGESNKDMLRLKVLSTPLPEHIVDTLTRIQSSRPWTVQKLAKWSFRPADEVAATLATLVVAGKLDYNGNGYLLADESVRSA